MPTRTRRMLLPLAACALALAGCGGGATQAAPLPAERAVAIALEKAQQEEPIGKLVGKPVTAHGLITSYGEAEKLTAWPNEQTTVDENQRARKVWFVVFEGDAVGKAAPAAGDLVAPEDEHYSQVAVIIDAVTGQAIQESMLGPIQISTADMPELELPSAAE